MDVTPGYKWTEVGVVPEAWDVIQAFDLDPFITSGSRGWAKYYSDHGALFIRITNLSRDSIYPNLMDQKLVDLPQRETEASRTQLQNGDILISITADIGMIGYVSEVVPKPAYINQHIACLRISPEKADSKYFSYYLASPGSRRRFAETTDVGAKSGINLTTVGKLRLLLPSLPEQRAIAKAVSDVDTLLGGLDRLISKKRDLKQAAMQQLLTGQTRLPGFHGEWEVKRLEDLGVWKGGMTPSMQNPAYWLNGTIPWVSSGEVKSTQLSETGFSITGLALKQGATTLVPKQSLLVVARSGILRKYLPIALILTPMAINQDIKALIPKSSFCTEFLLHALIYHGPRMLSQCMKAGTTVESIEFRWLKSCAIHVPKLAEQTAIAAMLSDMDAELAALEARRDKTRALKQAMMHELLTGKTRLSPTRAPHA